MSRCRPDGCAGLAGMTLGIMRACLIQPVIAILKPAGSIYEIFL